MLFRSGEASSTAYTLESKRSVRLRTTAEAQWAVIIADTGGKAPEALATVSGRGMVSGAIAGQDWDLVAGEGDAVVLVNPLNQSTNVQLEGAGPVTVPPHSQILANVKLSQSRILRVRSDGAIVTATLRPRSVAAAAAAAGDSNERQVVFPHFAAGAGYSTEFALGRLTTLELH